MGCETKRFLPRKARWSEAMWALVWPVLGPLVVLFVVFVWPLRAPPITAWLYMVFLLALVWGIEAVRLLRRRSRRVREFQIGPDGLTIVREQEGPETIPLDWIRNVRRATSTDWHYRRCDLVGEAWYDALYGWDGWRRARRSGLVFVEVIAGRPLLVATDRPEDFVRALEAVLLAETGSAGTETGLFLLPPAAGFYRFVAAAWMWLLVLGVLAWVLVDVSLLAPPLTIVGCVVVYWLLHGFLRPDGFGITPAGLRIGWRYRRGEFGRDEIVSVRLIPDEEVGRLGLPVNLGILGFFGRTRSSRLGPVEVYITRRDGMVLIDRRNDRPLLISPERPETFVEMLNRVIRATPRPEVLSRSPE